MSAPALGRLRRLWRDVHLWIGVGLLAALAPIGLTGALLVWSQPIGRMLEPQRYNAADGPAALAPSVYLAAARQALGADTPPTNLRFPEQRGEPVTASGRVWGRKSADGFPLWRSVWMDPKTAAVRDVGLIGSPLFNIAIRFHGSLMLPGLGRQVIGAMGGLMFISAATGLWLWWPPIGPVADGLRWRRSKSTLTNLHHQVGFWICIPLAAVSLTGLYICFPKTGQDLAGPFLPQGGVAGAQPLRTFSRAPLAKPLTIDEVAALATAGGEGRLLSLALPEADQAPVWTVQLVRQGAAPLSLTIDGARGVVKAASPTPPPQQLLGAIRDIHGGGGLGPAWSVIVFLTGLAPSLLGATGLVMWLRRRAARAA